MKSLFWGMLLLLVACSCASAAPVWRAQKDNAVIYLGGTCHVLREKDFPLPPEFDQAYRVSQVVVFETDIGKINDPLVQQRFLAKALYADGSTIDKHLSPKAYAELAAYCAANGIPLEAFRQVRPSLVIMALTLMEFSKMGVTEQGVDRFYYDLAKREKKSIEQFETVDQQIDYVVSMADGHEDEFVTHSLGEMKSIKSQFEELLEAWRSGDAAKIDEIMISELKTKQPKLYKTLITDRNRNWLTLIDSYRNSPKTRFILVGVGHLVGPDGIIEVLKKKGYKVEKL